MGLLLSVIISYAGINDALETIRHILSGVLPDTDPDFQDLVEYYSRLLQKSANPSTAGNWSGQCGQGYLCLTEDKNGKLKSAAVKYYDGQLDSTAILFSTKISSFGQDSVDENSQSQANGDYRSDIYLPTVPTKTKTIVTNTSESFSVGARDRTPTVENIPTSIENISDPIRISGSENSFEHDEGDNPENNEAKEKLTWHYRPKSPTTPQTQTLPEIHFQSFEDDKKGVYSEDFLRSLDGIKYRPLQRSDPSGRRRSFKKRHSSSSNSSRESRASREEELKMFTSLEEAEFERMTSDDNVGNFGSTPNLAARSYSRSHSRENSRERRNETWTADGAVSVDSLPEEDLDTADADRKPLMKDLPKLDSYEEGKDEAKETEVTEEEEVDDFWGSSGD